ncbi:MAG: 3-oxoacyl-ACP reductase FabG [Eubacterium sp.]|nr:3-oxoacyl-ACP reductase FabG [Eubacterium sp.]
MRLSGKIAIVTGGSRGIGFATVKRFVEEGATVVLCASRQETADKAVAQLKELIPEAKVEGIAPDLSDMDALQEAFAAVVEKYGRLDILVNNAGVAEMTPFENYTDEIFDKVMDLNLKALFHGSKVASDIMVKQGSGVILNTSSMVSKYAQPSGIAYPTSKFAVNGFTLSLARELAPKGIRVNAVAPGITETDMMKSVPKEMIEPLIAQVPLGRLGQPEDIANAYVFLASEEASYISGVVLSVDGLARS